MSEKEVKPLVELPHGYRGVLCAHNAKAIADRLAWMLGGKEYSITSIVVWAGKTDNRADMSPQVDVRQGHMVAEWCDKSTALVKHSIGKLDLPESDIPFISIMFSGSDGYLYHFSSNAHDTLRRGDGEAYFCFDSDQKLTITSRAPAGNLCIHVFTVIGEIRPD